MDNDTIEPPILKHSKYIVKCTTPEATVLNIDDYIYLDIYANSVSEAIDKTLESFDDSGINMIIIVDISQINQIKLKWSV